MCLCPWTSRPGRAICNRSRKLSHKMPGAVGRGGVGDVRGSSTAGKSKQISSRAEEAAEKLIGVAQPWEGTPFRRGRALNLAALTARLKPCPSTNVPIPAFFPQPVKPARNDKNKGLNGTLRLPLRTSLRASAIQGMLEVVPFPKQRSNRVFPQPVKPSLIWSGFRGPEGPLFHGTTRIHGAARMRQLVCSV